MRRGRIELTHELGRFQSRAIFSLGGLFYLGAAQPPDKNCWSERAQFNGRNQDTSVHKRIDRSCRFRKEEWDGEEFAD